MRRKPHMSGPFDWLKKLLPPVPGPKSQLPAVRESMLPAEVQKKKQFLDFFKPKTAEETGTLIQFPAFLNVLIPAASPKKPEKAKPEKEVWEGLFQPEKAPQKEIIETFKPEPTTPTPEMFEFLKPSARQEAILHTHPQEWPYGEPPIWSTTRWQMPSTYELAEMINQKWDLPGIYEFVLSQVDTRWWKRAVEESPHTGEPAAIDINQVSTSEPPYNDMGAFLNIPDYVIERYGAFGHDGLERFNLEVLQPMLMRISKALDVFKPTRELRGWFELEPDQDMHFWLRYKEAKFSQLG